MPFSTKRLAHSTARTKSVCINGCERAEYVSFRRATAQPCSATIATCWNSPVPTYGRSAQAKNFSKPPRGCRLTRQHHLVETGLVWLSKQPRFCHAHAHVRVERDRAALKVLRRSRGRSFSRRIGKGRARRIEAPEALAQLRHSRPEISPDRKLHMKSRHAAAFALVGCYLMVAPSTSVL